MHACIAHVMAFYLVAFWGGWAGGGTGFALHALLFGMLWHFLRFGDSGGFGGGGGHGISLPSSHLSCREAGSKL